MVNCFSLGGEGRKSPRPGIDLLKDPREHYAILNGIDRFFLADAPKHIPEDKLYDTGAIETMFAGEKTPWVGIAPEGQLILYSCDIGESGIVTKTKQIRYIYVYVFGKSRTETYALGDSTILTRWFDLEKDTQEILVKMNPHSSAIALGGIIAEYRGDGRFVSS